MFNVAAHQRLAPVLCVHAISQLRSLQRGCQNLGAIELIYAMKLWGSSADICIKHEKLLIYGGKSAAYDKIDPKELPMTIWYCVWSLVRLEGRAAEMTKLTQKSCFMS